jgi:transcription-repair coupling factor (superfamily II helicase)
MYLRLLEETVGELKGEERPLEIHSTLNLGLDIRIPAEYISDEHQRLRAYKRIADARDAEQAATCRAEIADRYGPPPAAVETLISFALLKREAEQCGIEAVDRRGSALTVKFHPGSKIDPAKLMTLVTQNEGAQFTPAGVLRLPLTVPPDHAPGVLEFLKKALETLAPSVHSV